MNKKWIIFIPFLVGISLLVGIFIGNMTRNNSRSVFPIISVSNTSKITSILNLIEHGYVDKVDINEITEKTIPNMPITHREMCG